MNLPEGVRYTPEQLARLIATPAKAGDALISIEPSLGYKIVDRDFKTGFQDLFSDDYRAFAHRYHLMSRFPVYSGAEHKGDPKLPNITVVPNVPTRRAQSVHLQFDQKTFNIGRALDFRMPTGQEVTLFGCTMGHWHGQADCPDGIQEIYEFQSYGALLIDDPESDEVELLLARDGDKVAVPQQRHMTLYNLDDADHPLITLDFANPNRNYANKELVKAIGPAVLGYYTAHEAVFTLNQHYVNREAVRLADDEFIDPAVAPSGQVNNQHCLNGGVRLPMPLPSREVRIPLGARASLGQQLYEVLTRDVQVIIQLARLGIRVRKASPDLQVQGVWYGRPLAECVSLGKQNRLYGFFFSGTGEVAENRDQLTMEIPKSNRNLHNGEGAWLKTGPRFLEPGRKPGEPAQKDILILIEGAGDWVEKGFIPSIERAREKLAVRRENGQHNLPDFRVIIADDSRWHSPGATTPVKPNREIYPEVRRVVDQGLNREHLFSLQWSSLCSELSAVGAGTASLPGGVHQALAARQLSLSQPASISRVADNTWRITAGDHTYTLLKEDSMLHVYLGVSYGIAGPNVPVSRGPVRFLDKADPADLLRYQTQLPGVVFIVTPDYTHSALCRHHLDRAPTVFVEKPFDANWENVRALLEARGRAALDTEIYALDHYRFYAWHLRELLQEATAWLGGALREARFCMTETGPVEPHRIRALQYGMLLDMLPHCLAMLAFFGKIDSLDEFEVSEVGRYEGAPIPSETYAHVQLSFEDYSDNSWRVPCRAWVGKGLSAGRKYFEVVGRNGKSVLVALGKTTWRHQGEDREIDGGIYFVDAQGQLNEKPRAPLDKDRYKQLLLDMMTGQREAIVCAMPLVAGEQIVHALDRFWVAVQAHSPWKPYALGGLDCGGL